MSQSSKIISYIAYGYITTGLVFLAIQAGLRMWQFFANKPTNFVLLDKDIFIVWLISSALITCLAIYLNKGTSK